jgi:hypothetical protein
MKGSTFSLCAVALIAACAPTQRVEAVTRARPKPLITLTDTGYVIVLTPYWFILYDDGEVIARRSADGFVSVVLTADERDALVRQVQKNLRGQEGFTDLNPETSDLRVRRIEFPDPPDGGSVGVRAHWERIPEAALPPGFAAAYRMLSGFSHPHERPWRPPTLELYAEKGSGGPGCPWPAEWNDKGPQLSPYVSRGGPRLYEVKGDWLEGIEKFLRECPRRLVSMDGETVHVHVEAAMPHERL